MFTHPKCPLFLAISHFGTPFNTWISFMDQFNCFLLWETFLGHPSPTIYYMHVCFFRNRRCLSICMSVSLEIGDVWGLRCCDPVCFISHCLPYRKVLWIFIERINGHSQWLTQETVLIVQFRSSVPQQGWTFEYLVDELILFIYWLSQLANYKTIDAWV